MKLARAGRAIVLTLGLVALLVAEARGASPLEKMLSKRVDADPRKDYPLLETHGPWLILATTFSGDGAKDQAKKLTLELREKYRLPAYVYQKRFDFSQGERGRGIDKYGDPLKMRYRRGDELTEIAVLVGDFRSVDDPEGQRTLKKVKYLTPLTLDPEKNKSTSQTLAGLRMMQRAVMPDGSDQKKRGPMGSAFMITNPLLPPEYFAPKGIDKLVLDMNKGVKHSLLDCKGKYTVKVATFTGQVVLDQKKIEQIEHGAHFKSRLEEAAEKANALCEALRAKGVEAYEFHDRAASIVTVGSFDSVGTPRGDGKIEINPAMHAIIQTYGAETKLLPGQTTPQLGRPKSLKNPHTGKDISFDISPTPVETPRRSFAVDYQHTTASR